MVYCLLYEPPTKKQASKKQANQFLIQGTFALLKLPTLWWGTLRILNESQISTKDVGTEYDTGKTKITCYYAASFRT